MTMMSPLSIHQISAKMMMHRIKFAGECFLLFLFFASIFHPSQTSQPRYENNPSDHCDDTEIEDSDEDAKPDDLQPELTLEDINDSSYKDEENNLYTSSFCKQTLEKVKLIFFFPFDEQLSFPLHPTYALFFPVPHRCLQALQITKLKDGVC
jgi:hypothetical protein